MSVTEVTVTETPACFIAARIWTSSDRSASLFLSGVPGARCSPHSSPNCRQQQAVSGQLGLLPPCGRAGVGW